MTNLVIKLYNKLNIRFSEINNKYLFFSSRCVTIGICKILRKISNNAYVLEIPEDLGRLSIFNIVGQYKYEEGSTSGSETTID